LGLIGAGQARLENRRHFFAAASRLTRQAPVDLARERAASNAAARPGVYCSMKH